MTDEFARCLFPSQRGSSWVRNSSRNKNLGVSLHIPSETSFVGFLALDERFAHVHLNITKRPLVGCRAVPVFDMEVETVAGVFVSTWILPSDTPPRRLTRLFETISKLLQEVLNCVHLILLIPFIDWEGL
ncbi:hypothetical protein TNIN_256131 [Trichonephila inaurata madagascariensis]|uniref:Uncharacterized protein n=1 Tax=Trichonephila inaurata madagascariensis TaxID=2747483 RepID=A0A8X6YL83_9ARAC|nr:hypothetical protein TNIN_256131 [Trichonephila inaurata madagascariensis]